jgi:hypothetical protein
MSRRLVATILFPALACILACACAAAQEEETENADRMLWASGKVSKFVDLAADHPVDTEFFSTKERMKEVMRMFFRRDFPDDKYWAMNAVMLKFGFGLFEDDSEDEIVDDYTKGILGVYDDEDKKIYVVESSLYQKLRKERYEECNVDNWYASDPVWEDWWNRNRADIVLVHEATHALQDMRFNLRDWHDKYEWNDDAHLGIRSVIEGQAEFVETKYTYEALKLTDYGAAFYNYGDSWDMRLFSAVDDYIDRNSDEFGSCRDEMTFLWWMSNVPYIFGNMIMRKIEGEQSAGRINDTYTRCPLSSEQVMNSDKYFKEKHEDRPTFIDFPSFDDLIDTDEWRFLDYNSMGQLKLYLLCRDLMYDAVNDCHPMAEGWDGDRYLVWRNEDDEIFMAWYTTWDTERDAKEFYNFFLNARGRRAGSGGASSSGDNYKLIRDGEDSSYTEIRGNSVVILEGPMIEDDGRQDFADRLWESELYEASYDICTMSAEEFDDGYIGFTGDQEEEADGDSGADDEEEDDDEDSETVSGNHSEDEE